MGNLKQSKKVIYEFNSEIVPIWILMSLLFLLPSLEMMNPLQSSDPKTKQERIEKKMLFLWLDPRQRFMSRRHESFAYCPAGWGGDIRGVPMRWPQRVWAAISSDVWV